MVLIAVGTLCGILSALAALALQFRFPGWETLAGLAGLEAGRRKSIDEQPLRRRISILFYFLSLGVLATTVTLAIKSISPSVALPLALALILVTFDLMLLAWKKYDSSSRESPRRRGTRLVVLFTHALFLAVLLFLPR